MRRYWGYRKCCCGGTEVLGNKKGKMKVKISIIIVGILLFQFISSCCRSVKYYDFTKMDVQLSSNIIKQDENLTIKLIAIDLEYLSLNLSDFGFASSFALSCDDGWGGMKYPFEKIEITSSSDFNNESSANENLAPLFQIRKFLGNGEFEFVNISEIKLEEFRGDYIELMLSERPTNVLTHNFQLKLTKSNQEEIVLKTQDITWQ